MPEIPHEYTVAGKATAGVPPVPDDWYAWFVEQIRQHGYQGEFGGRTYTYLNVDDWKYWSLPGSDGVTIINRARLATSSVDVIDVTFDFRSDTPGYGRPRVDPDASSPTLKRYHRLLWSKPLPSGAPFMLDDTTPGAYLHHRSGLGEFWLSGDAVIPTWSRWKKPAMKYIIDQIPEVEREAFFHLGYTIGGMMVFPSNQVGRKPTINGARGFDARIADRFDLTLECIRRHYLDDPVPCLLGGTLARYADFFGLFGDFAGYVDFFLLQDLVDEAASTVKFFTPFEDFTESPLPATLGAYLEYRQRATEFIESRNRRIAAYRLPWPLKT